MTASVGSPALTMISDPARLLQRCDELLDGLGANEIALVAVLVDERVRLGDAAVVQRHRVAVAGEVAGDVAIP